MDIEKQDENIATAMTIKYTDVPMMRNPLSDFTNKTSVKSNVNKSGGGTSKPKPGPRSELPAENKSVAVGEESFVIDKGDQLSECSFISAVSQSKGVDTDTDTTADYESAGESDTSPYGSLLIHQDVKSPGNQSTSTGYSVGSSDQDGELTVINVNSTFTESNPLSVTRLADELESILNISTPTKKETFSANHSLPDSSINASDISNVSNKSLNAPNSSSFSTNSDEIQERFKELTSNIFSFVSSRQESSGFEGGNSGTVECANGHETTVPLLSSTESNDKEIPVNIFVSGTTVKTEPSKIDLFRDTHKQSEHITPTDSEITEPKVEKTDPNIVNKSFDNDPTVDSSGIHEELSTLLPKDSLSLSENTLEFNKIKDVESETAFYEIITSDQEPLNCFTTVSSDSIGNLAETVHNERLDSKSLSGSNDKFLSSSDQPEASANCEEYSLGSIEAQATFNSGELLEPKNICKTSDDNTQNDVIVDEAITKQDLESPIKNNIADSALLIQNSCIDTVSLISHQANSERTLLDRSFIPTSDVSNYVSVSQETIPVLFEIIRNEELGDDKYQQTEKEVILTPERNVFVETHIQSNTFVSENSVTDADINVSLEVETCQTFTQCVVPELHSSLTPVVDESTDKEVHVIITDEVVDKCSKKESHLNEIENVIVKESIENESIPSTTEQQVSLVVEIAKESHSVITDTAVNESTQKQSHFSIPDPLVSECIVPENIENKNFLSSDYVPTSEPEPSFGSDGPTLLKECVDTSDSVEVATICEEISDERTDAIVHSKSFIKDESQGKKELSDKASIDDLGALFEELKIKESVINNELETSISDTCKEIIVTQLDIESPFVESNNSSDVSDETRNVDERDCLFSDIVTGPGKAYKDMSELIATCSKQEKELQTISEEAEECIGYDETFREEAKRIALDISNSSSSLCESVSNIKETRGVMNKKVSQKSLRPLVDHPHKFKEEPCDSGSAYDDSSLTKLTQCMMRSAASPDINRSEAGPVTADEHFREGESFQDATKFDFEFLSRLDNQSKGRHLVRKSLIVKFDPLYQSVVADQESQKITTAMSDSASSEVEGKILRDGGATPIKTEDESEPVQKLVSLTPPKSETPARPKTAVNSLSTPPTVRQDILSKEILKLQELMIQQEQSYQEQLMSKSEMIEEQKQRIQVLEAKDSRDILEEKLRANEAKLKSTETKLSKAEKELADSILSRKQLTMIMEEYEKTISQLITKREDEKKELEQVKETIATERDTALKHLSNMEVAFNDVHQKYERCKTVIEQMKVNEVAFKESLAVNEKTINKLEADYQKLKKHASEKLEAANEELAALRKSHHGEVAKLKAIAKKSEIKNKSLEDSLEQKQKEVRELTQICDELIGKVEHQ